MEKTNENEVLCKVGGWEIMAVPGTEFTFGQGCYCWGPIPVLEVTDDILNDVIGSAVAVAVALKTEKPWVCGCCNGTGYVTFGTKTTRLVPCPCNV